MENEGEWGIPMTSMHATASNPEVQSTKFIGRRDELRALGRLWQRAWAGTIEMVDIVGPPGSGSEGPCECLQTAERIRPSRQ